MLLILGGVVGVFAVLLVTVALGQIKRADQQAQQTGHDQVERAVSAAESTVNRTLVGVDMLLAETADWVRELPPGAAAQQRQSPKGQNLQRLLKAALNQNLMLRDVASSKVWIPTSN